jgi:hypothetical protein
MTHPKNNNKDVIYIDVDDEITGIIDKVQASEHHIVALVLPKRASVFQSVVNMKLLKSAAEKSKKNVVLITSEASLMPLAGGVGMHVAKSLQSKPEVPEAPAKVDDKADTIEEAVDEPDLDKSKTVGELSGDEDEAIELDDEDDDGASGKSDAKKSAKGKNKKLKIPNFDRFRLLLIGGGAALVALIIFGFLAFSVLPKARVTITTDSSAIDVSQDVTLKPGDNVTLDVEQGIVPATSQEVKKTLSQTVAATGQQNNGEKATGSIDMTAKDCNAPYNPPADVAAGSGVTTGGNTYITQKKANFSLDGASGGCVNFKSSSINIVAQSAGTKYNVDSATFAVAGRSDISATGSASGGTDSIIKVVSQADIDSAKQKIGEQDVEAVKLELMQGLQSKGLYPIESTFNTAAPSTKQNVNAGQEAENVTVTQELSYTMLGVKREDLQKLVDNIVKDQIDTTKQAILDYGLDEAVFTAFSPKPEGTTAGMQVTVIAGPELKAEEIKKQVAGKKAGDATELIKENPGVTDVEVKYSPFWVSSIPKKTSKITVIIEKPKVSSDAQQSNQ